MNDIPSSQLIDLFQRARKHKKLAVIEGVQALKHAGRFEAAIQQIVTSDKAALESLLHELAPDAEHLSAQATEVSEEVFSRLSPQPPRTKVIALAERRSYILSDLTEVKPVVLLEDSRDLENIGAVIRVAAAAEAAGVCIIGKVDIWHPAVLRGAAGLHYALPVLNVQLKDVLSLNRPLVALDPEGEETRLNKIKNPVLVFGTERYGISKGLLKRCDERIRLSMKAGVSSLNLATSVAATLYRM